MENMLENSLKTPVTNRGVTHTQDTNLTLEFKGEINKLNQFILFDWFEATIPLKLSDNLTNYQQTNFLNYSMEFRHKIKQIFKNVFKINENDVLFCDKGINGYSEYYYYSYIKMYFNPNYPLMGIHLLMSGQGCRDFDTLGLSYKDLILAINDMGGKYSRVDIAIDDFTNNYFTLKKLKRYVDHKQIKSKFRTYYSVRKGLIEDNVVLGDTLQFGSRASLVQITFYDKLQERANNNYYVDENIKFWVRCELRFRAERCAELLESYLQHDDLNDFVKGVLYEHIDFLEKSKTDSNKWRWSTANWWLDYLENINKIKFVPLNFESSITKKRAWIEKSVEKSNAMCFFSSYNPNIPLDEYLKEYFIDMLFRGVDKFEDKDVQSINIHRLSHKKDGFTKEVLNDYMRDFKDFIIEIDIKKRKNTFASDNQYYVNFSVLVCNFT